MKGLFVCGTDTGVGKTEVACFVASLWRSRGLSVGAAKPAETGVIDEPADAERLKEAAGDPRPLAEVCAYRLRDPLAPLVAAEREGKTLDPARLLACVEGAWSGRDRVIAETAGGLLVPYAKGFDGIDLVARSGLPALLVGRLGLGTINHSRLSVEALKAREVKVAALVLSVGGKESAPPVGDIAAETNPGVLTSLLPGIPVVVFPVVDTSGKKRRETLPLRVPALEELVV